MIGNDKIALVTGAGQGIGKDIARTLAKNGAKMVILSDINKEVLTATTDEFLEEGLAVDSYAADVSSDAEVKEMVGKLIAKYSRIDILVNNAGTSIKNADNTKKFTLDIEVDEWDKILGNNLRSVFLCSKYVARHMIKNGYGKIINMSSILGKTGCPGEKMDNYCPISGTSGSHYCASKAGIINFTKSLARELGKYNINVNAVAPGAVSGGMGKFGGEIVDRMKTQIPLGRIAVHKDVSDCVLFLSSDMSNYITGDTVNINGGWFMD